MRKFLLALFAVCFGFAAHAQPGLQVTQFTLGFLRVATNQASAQSYLGSSGGGGGATNGIQQLNGTGTNITLSNLTVIGTLGGSSIWPVANGGTAASTPRSAAAAIGVFPLSSSSADTQYHYKYEAPAFANQLGYWLNGQNVANFMFSASTTTGDWEHGFAFPTGLQYVGDLDLEDSHITGIVPFYISGNPANWSHTGDDYFEFVNGSRSASDSGIAINFAVMRDGFGVTSVSIVSGGTGYAQGDNIFISSGTLGIKSIAAKAVVSAVSGGVVSAVKLFAYGEYITAPSGTVGTTTSGSGSGLTLTCTAQAKAIYALNSPSCAINQTPNNRPSSLLNGWFQTVLNHDNTYNKGVAISSPGGGSRASGLDSGNYGYLFADMSNSVTRIPKWVNGSYQPSDSGYLDTFTADPVTGNVGIPNGNLTLGGSGTIATVTGVPTAIPNITTVSNIVQSNTTPMTWLIASTNGTGTNITLNGATLNNTVSVTGLATFTGGMAGDASGLTNLVGRSYQATNGITFFNTTNCFPNLWGGEPTINLTADACIVEATNGPGEVLLTFNSGDGANHNILFPTAMKSYGTNFVSSLQGTNSLIVLTNNHTVTLILRHLQTVANPNATNTEIFIGESAN